jgi:uncharacterized protein
MSIAVISDTHGNVSQLLLSRLAGYEMILHLGDLGPIRLLTDLETIAPTLAVAGNTDLVGSHQLPRLRNLNIDGQTIFMQHFPWDSWDPTLDKPGIYLHGHIHAPRFEPSHRSLIICPGAIHNPRDESAAGFVSLDLSPHMINAHFIALGTGEVLRRESFKTP